MSTCPATPSLSHHQRGQNGLSLIELMIAMVLGLLVVFAVFNIYSGNTRSSAFTEGLQSIQENGRYGVATLLRSFRMAGYSTEQNASQPPLLAIDIANSSASEIVLQSQQPFDCNGESTASVGNVAINTYSFDAASDQISCEGNVGAVAMPVVEGVEEFRVLYGLDEDGDSETLEPQRFVPYDSSLAPAEIVALRFALLVNSGTAVRSHNRSEKFVILDKEVSRNDRLVREVFSSTVMLRNK
ncbi:MAG: PilW family protein [Granulosicoccus sp.]|nr:PilW family protein [Granulosicoccus sp.]